MREHSHLQPRSCGSTATGVRASCCNKHSHGAARRGGDSHSLPKTTVATPCRLGQLSDGFVEQPADAFPEGSLVVGQVLNTEGGK